MICSITVHKANMLSLRSNVRDRLFSLTPAAVKEPQANVDCSQQFKGMAAIPNFRVGFGIYLNGESKYGTIFDTPLSTRPAEGTKYRPA